MPHVTPSCRRPRTPQEPRVSTWPRTDPTSSGNGWSRDSSNRSTRRAAHADRHLEEVDMARETEKEGMSTGKKVAAGAAIGVAVPTAVGVAKKLLGNGDDGDERQGRSAGRSRRATTRSTSSTRRGASSRAKGRTKEQLYNQAKR